MKRKIIIASFVLMFCVIFSGVVLFAADGTTTTAENAITNAPLTAINWGKFVGAGLAMAGAAIGSGIGVGKIGSAAMGAISEKPETTGISLVMVALAEGISILGLVIAILILNSK
jgi:V/A-type H+-transporting ATPase subunit K